MQLATSVYCNRDLTKKREMDKKSSLLNHSSQGVSPQWGLTPGFGTTVDKRGTSAGNAQKGDSQRDSPSLHWDHAPSSRVITRGLSAPSPRRRQNATSYGLMGPGSSCPGSTSWHQCWGASGNHNSGEVKGHLSVRQWSLFLCLTIFSWPLVQWQVYHSRNTWPVPGVLFTQALACSCGDLHSVTLFS
jgi:hypothetical protein